MIHKIVLNGHIPVNCYIIEDEGQCYIVDPGSEKKKLQSFIASKDLEVLGILLTHGHFDHIGALNAYDVPIYLHEDEFELINDGLYNGFDFENRQMTIDFSTLNLVSINEQTELYLNQRKIKIFHTPGHTPGGVCYQIGQELISGDTLFQGAVGRWDFPLGNQNALKDSVCCLLDLFEDEMIIYPGHGNPSTIGMERQINPYYEHWQRTGSLIVEQTVQYDLFQKGKTLVETRQFSHAAEVFKQLINMNDTNPLTYMYYQYIMDQMAD